MFGFLLLISAGGCSDTGIGAGVGAGGGALVGSAVGHPWIGALVGRAGGAVAGHEIGNSQNKDRDQPPRPSNNDRFHRSRMSVSGVMGSLGLQKASGWLVLDAMVTSQPSIWKNLPLSGLVSQARCRIICGAPNAAAMNERPGGPECPLGLNDLLTGDRVHRTVSRNPEIVYHSDTALALRRRPHD
jgi:Glycine zipper